MSTTTVPQIRPSSTPGSAVLDDFRLDHLVSQIALRWRQENEALAASRKSESPRLASISDGYAAQYLGYAAELHCKRALKALRSGREMPLKVTATQAADGLKNEDLPELNRRVLEVLDQHILLLAKDLGVCAVMFSDPAAVVKNLDL